MGKIYKVVFIFITLLVYVLACSPDTPREEAVEEKPISSEELEDQTVDHSYWLGIWEREGAIDPASISITNIKNSEFEFHINAYDGINTSEISGVATIEDNVALFMAASAEDTCRISFLLQDSLLFINQVNDYCSGVTEIDFSGEYFHERFFKEKVMDEDAATGNRNKLDN